MGRGPGLPPREARRERLGAPVRSLQGVGCRGKAANPLWLVSRLLPMTGSAQAAEEARIKRVPQAPPDRPTATVRRIVWAAAPSRDRSPARPIVGMSDPVSCESRLRDRPALRRIFLRCSPSVGFSRLFIVGHLGRRTGTGEPAARSVTERDLLDPYLGGFARRKHEYGISRLDVDCGGMREAAPPEPLAERRRLLCVEHAPRNRDVLIRLPDNRGSLVTFHRPSLPRTRAFRAHGRGR